MLVLLKSLSLALWLFIMLAIILAYRRNSPKRIKDFKFRADRDYYRNRTERYLCLTLIKIKEVEV